jgi:hypothetical protein
MLITLLASVISNFQHPKLCSYFSSLLFHSSNASLTLISVVKKWRYSKSWCTRRARWGRSAPYSHGRRQEHNHKKSSVQKKSRSGGEMQAVSQLVADASVDGARGRLVRSCRSMQYMKAREIATAIARPFKANSSICF